jgi:hypothetical protein
MIKTFEEFNNDILCEAYIPQKPKVIEDLTIYSKADNNGICKTWNDVLKLFSNPKYNVKCASPHKRVEHKYYEGSIEKTYWNKYDDTLLQILKQLDNIWYIGIHNGTIYIKYNKESVKLYILSDLGKKAKGSTDLSKSQYHTKIRMDLLDWYNDPTNFDDTKDSENDNIIKNLILYDDFPTNDEKPNRTWEEAIQILSNPKYNVKCAILSLNKRGYGKYKYIHDDKEYRYNSDDIRREDSIIEEIERIQKFNKGSYKSKYKRISICDGAIVYTAQIKNYGEYKCLIIPLNDQGAKIRKWENEDILDSKYRIKIEQDIFDDIDTTINNILQKIKTAETKENIDSILKNAFKSTTQEQYSIISACTLCREIELGIWEPTDINSEDIIKAIEERFGITYSTEK